MEMQYRNTRHQVARGTKADAETSTSLFLFKNVSTLRLTYQIRLLAYRAAESQRKLIIRVPSSCKLHQTLRDFLSLHLKLLRIERI